MDIRIKKILKKNKQKINKKKVILEMIIKIESHTMKILTKNKLKINKKKVLQQKIIKMESRMELI